jgi:dihydroorotase
MNIEIKNGRVIDPKNGVDRSISLYIAEGNSAPVIRSFC